MVEIALFERGWVTLNENFRGKGASPATNFGVRKLESLGYRMVKKIAENVSRLNRAHQRHRQTTDRQTDKRQTTDGRPIAYTERNVVRSLNKYFFTNRIVDLWNSLPNEVVYVQSLHTFKYKVSCLNL